MSSKAGTNTDDSELLTAEDVGQLVGYQLRVAQIASYRAFEGGLAAFGVAPRYLGLLAIIRQHPGQPQARLASAIALGPSTLVPIIDRLERDGLVERRSAVGDRRIRTVWLTAAGEAVVGELLSLAHAHDDVLTAGLTVPERATLLRLLRRVVDNLQDG